VSGGPGHAEAVIVGLSLALLDRISALGDTLMGRLFDAGLVAFVSGGMYLLGRLVVQRLLARFGAK
jgi:hypothetical protein